MSDLPDGGQAVRVVEAYADAWLAGDLETVLGLYHPDLTLVWPGTHRLAGEHRGLDAALTALAELQALTERRPIEIHAITDADGTIVLDVTERWRDRESGSTDVRRALHYTVLDDRLHTCRIVEADESAVDRWMQRAAAAAALERDNPEV